MSQEMSQSYLFDVLPYVIFNAYEEVQNLPLYEFSDGISTTFLGPTLVVLAYSVIFDMSFSETYLSITFISSNSVSAAKVITSMPSSSFLMSYSILFLRGVDLE